MIPVILDRGKSFYGAFAYFCHDKQEWTTERVAWTRCLNLMTDCVEKAWKRMAYTALHQKELKRASGQLLTGAKMKKPVFSYVLSWHPEQRPSQEHMMDVVNETLSLLDLSDHQAVVAAHRDEPHSHVHVFVNVVHPLTGLVANLKNTKRKLSKFALNYERKEGKVYCPQRERNHARREAGEKVKYCDPVIEAAWRESIDGRGFMNTLKVSGYQLAQGRRILVVDPHGNIINPARDLGIKVKDFKAQMKDLDLREIPSVESLKLKSGSAADAQSTPPLSIQPEEAKPLGFDCPELLAMQSAITRQKEKLRESGMLAKVFGLQAYRKRKLVKMRRQFQKLAKGERTSSMHEDLVAD